MFLIFLINFLLAISTTVGMTLIPFLVTDSLGLSLFVLGLLEGTTEFLSNVLRLSNGILFDKLKNKRLIFVYSVGMALVAKCLLLIPSAWTVACSKTLERVANGAFASPRDAWVADQAKKRGIALGFIGLSKSAGCIVGPLLVSCSTLCLGSLQDNLGSLIVLCCVLVLPAFIASFFLKVNAVQKSVFSLQEMSAIIKKISPILFLTFLFFLGRFNDGIILIYLKKQGFPEWFYLSTISIFNFIMMISAPLIGNQMDRGHFKEMFYLSMGALGIFGLAFIQIEGISWAFAMLGLIAWGIQRTGAQIVFASLIFKNISKANYGTAIGMYYIVSGLATMLSSFLCGYLANHHYFPFIFMLSSGCGFFTLLLAVTVLGNRWSMPYAPSEA